MNNAEFILKKFKIVGYNLRVYLNTLHTICVIFQSFVQIQSIMCHLNIILPCETMNANYQDKYCRLLKFHTDVTREVAQ